jgi:hypothetical protein
MKQRTNPSPEEVLRRMLSTPPKPRAKALKPKPKKQRK